MADPFKARTMKRKNVKGLALSNNAPKAPEPSAADAQIPGAIGNGSALDTLEIGIEFQPNLKTDELVVLREIGSGNGGTVSKVMHPATQIVMARKIIHVEAKEAVRKNIVRELHIMKDCSSPNIVTFYGAFLNDAGDVNVFMEFMDTGSLDRISKDFGPVRVDVLGKISVAVLHGLIYLYEEHRIMHRDIKPSNVLVNSKGMIKLCDFGVSGELVNSIANTFVGTSTYMAPERIQGSQYTIRSDVWSVGLMIMELAIGRFPFDASETSNGDRDDGVGGILDLLQQIVHEPPPRLPKSSAFPTILDDMIQACLQSKADLRPSPRELYDNDAFIQAAKRTPVDLEAWAVEMMSKANRKSHLQAPPSPGTQALLRSGAPPADPASAASSSAAARTPPSADPHGHGGAPSATATASTARTPDSVGDGPPPAAGAPFHPHHPHHPTPVAAAGMRLGGGGGADRPAFPPRTSSSGHAARPKDQQQQQPYGMAMPIRPAPPPGGPLPPPPGKEEMDRRRYPYPREGQPI